MAFIISTPQPSFDCALPPRIAEWRSLVRRSIDGWIVFPEFDSQNKAYVKKVLEDVCPTLDTFLGRRPEPDARVVLSTLSRVHVAEEDHQMVT